MEIPLDNKDVCDKLSDYLDSAFGTASDMVSGASDLLQTPFKSLSDMSDSLIAEGLDDKLKQIDDLRNDLLDGVTLSEDWGTKNPLLACIGANAGGIFGFNPLEITDGYFNPGMFPEMLGYIVKAVAEAFMFVLSAAEKAILLALDLIKNAIDLVVIDTVLGLVLCLTGHCPKESTENDYTMDVELEDMMQEHGLDLNGAVDLSKYGFDTDQITHIDALAKAQSNVENDIKRLAATNSPISLFNT